MKIFTLCLALLLCVKLHGATQDDIARAFLAGVVAQGVVPILTNATVVTPFGTAIITATNVASFSVAGGLVYFDLGKYTNLNGTSTLTNLSQVIVGGNTLTNTGDALRGQWGGKMANGLANTNRFTIMFGSDVILDTGLQTASNTTWQAEVLIVRTGLSSCHAEAFFAWGPGGGVPFIRTNVNLELGTANGISRQLSLNGASRRVGGHTNNSFFIQWTGLR